MSREIITCVTVCATSVVSQAILLGIVLSRSLAQNKGKGWRQVREAEGFLETLGNVGQLSSVVNSVIDLQNMTS